MIIGLVLLGVVVVLRSASTNRHVRGRLLVSAVAFALQAILGAVAAWGAGPPPLHEQVRLLALLLPAFGVINALVALAVNPWRTDRLPERFPTILQDTIVIVLFAGAATAVLQERVLAATAVSAVVIGLALQDTLGNFFAGLAIQIEKPFRVGQWVRVGSTDGIVTEITWRATKIRTKAGNFVVVPNSALAKDTIVNYSEPSAETRVEFEVGVSYAVPPNRVKETILAAVADEPLLSASGAEVLVANFGDSAVIYRVRAWTTDFAADERLKDRLRTAIYYAFQRTGIEIPFPIRTVLMKTPAVTPGGTEAENRRALEQVPIFTGIEPEALAQIAAGARRHLYAAGEAIVRQGEPGASMFVLLSGDASVQLGSGREVARIPAGGFFGEMSLLTGEPRSATVRAAVDAETLEIAADHFRAFVLANPSSVEMVAAAVAVRQAELHRARADDQVPAPADTRQGIVDRIRRFFGVAAI